MIRQIVIGKQFNKDKLLLLLNRGVLSDEKKLKTVRSIIKDIRTKGDKALLNIIKNIEGQNFSPKSLVVDKATIDAAIKEIDPLLLKSLKTVANRIAKYQKQQIPKSWFIKEKGITSGMIVRPLDKVGIYVPGGKASYPSSLLMNAIPAQVAGVKNIVICTPANRDGKINNMVLAAAKLLNIKKIFKVGGAQAVAAMAYGTKTIPKVDKITGPGNTYVTLAKKEVSGVVGIDMLAGPSEVLILADESANSKIVAADMLAQAEHGKDSMAILVTNSIKLANKVQKELAIQLKRLGKVNVSKSITDFGLIIKVVDMKIAINIVNEIGAEHLLIYAREKKSLLKKVKTAGAIFVGKNSAVALGDYAAGPNHTLPTMGSAAFSSPLGVEDFVKKSSYLEVDATGLEKLASTVEKLALSEGLEAHAYSVRVRKELKS